MVDASPSFEIYHDPPEEGRPSTKPPVSASRHPTRRVLSEIRLPNWDTQPKCGSALKHEILLSQPELSSQPESIPSESPSEESKENIPSKPLRRSSPKTPRIFPTSGLKRLPPTYTRCTPLPISVTLSNSRRPKMYEGSRKRTDPNVKENQAP